MLLASSMLILLFEFWRPIAGTVWATQGATAMALAALQALGWGLVLVSTCLIDHFELFGMKQVLAQLQGRLPAALVVRTPLFYKRVRHPIYLGFLIAFWSAPVMSAGHLLFTVATTGYILIDIWFEERDLITLFGDRYRQYRRQVGMLLPMPGRRLDANQAPAKEAPADDAITARAPRATPGLR